MMTGHRLLHSLAQDHAPKILGLPGRQPSSLGPSVKHGGPQAALVSNFREERARLFKQVEGCRDGPAPRRRTSRIGIVVAPLRKPAHSLDLGAVAVPGEGALDRLGRTFGTTAHDDAASDDAPFRVPP